MCALQVNLVFVIVLFQTLPCAGNVLKKLSAVRLKFVAYHQYLQATTTAGQGHANRNQSLTHLLSGLHHSYTVSLRTL